MDRASKAAKNKPVRRMGRPTLEESQELDEKIKAVALDLFLDRGFDAVTMEAVALASDITKRTLYMRYKDKTALFTAALHKSRDEWKSHKIDSKIERGKSLETQLLALASALLEQALSPRIIKLARIASAQADNFPEEIKNSYSMSLSPRMKSVVDTLKRFEGEIDKAYLKDIDTTAELFLGLITGIPMRLAGMGITRNPAYEKRRIKQAVKMFLNGIRVK